MSSDSRAHRNEANATSQGRFQHINLDRHAAEAINRMFQSPPPRMNNRASADRSPFMHRSSSVEQPVVVLSDLDDDEVIFVGGYEPSRPQYTHASNNSNRSRRLIFPAVSTSGYVPEEPTDLTRPDTTRRAGGLVRDREASNVTRTIPRPEERVPRRALRPSSMRSRDTPVSRRRNAYPNHREEYWAAVEARILELADRHVRNQENRARRNATQPQTRSHILPQPSSPLFGEFKSAAFDPKICFDLTDMEGWVQDWEAASFSSDIVCARCQDILQFSSDDPKKALVALQCGHMICADCHEHLLNHMKLVETSPQDHYRRTRKQAKRRVRQFECPVSSCSRPHQNKRGQKGVNLFFA